MKLTWFCIKFQDTEVVWNGLATEPRFRAGGNGGIASSNRKAESPSEADALSREKASFEVCCGNNWWEPVSSNGTCSLGARPLTADSSELGRQSKMRAQPSGSRVDMISSPKGSGGKIAKLCELSFALVTSVDLEPSLVREFPNALSVQVEDLAPW